VSNALVPLMLTLKVATAATLVVLVFGVSWAYLFGRFRFRGSQILDAVLTLPMVMPPTVLGYYLLVVIGRRRVAGKDFRDSINFHLARRGYRIRLGRLSVSLQGCAGGFGKRRSSPGECRARAGFQ